MEKLPHIGLNVRVCKIATSVMPPQPICSIVFSRSLGKKHISLEFEYCMSGYGFLIGFASFSFIGHGKRHPAGEKNIKEMKTE